jgi:hypothetical protein
MNERTERIDPTVAELYKLKPHALDVYTTDDATPRRIPLAGRNRWSKVKQTLDALPWTRIVALDPKGLVLGAMEPDEGSLDEGGDALDALTIAERMGHIVTDAIARTQKEDRLAFAEHFKATAELLEAMTDGVKSISEAYALALKVQAAYAAAPAGPAEPDIDDKMRDMALSVLAKQFGIPPEMAAMLGGKMMAPKLPPVQPAKPPTNGANGAPKPNPPQGAPK